MPAFSKKAWPGMRTVAARLSALGRVSMTTSASTPGSALSSRAAALPAQRLPPITTSALIPPALAACRMARPDMPWATVV